MRHRTLVTLLAVLATPLAPVAPAVGQPVEAWAVSRTPWGDADLQGAWTNVGMTPLERPAEQAGRALLTDEELAERADEAVLRRDDRQRSEGNPGDRQRLDRQGLYYNRFWFPWANVSQQTSLVVDPPDGRLPPFTSAGQARAAAGLETSQGTGSFEAIGRRGTDGPEQRSLWERCLTRVLPRLPGPYNNNVQILQTPDYVVILMEMIHESRVIPLDGRPHVAQRVRQWLGDSRGHWEGDTLVVDTTNFSGKVNFIGSGAEMHLVERFTRTGPDTVMHAVTVEDAATWERAWTARIPMQRSAGRLFEYACHEGNYGLAGILSGARAAERASGGR